MVEVLGASVRVACAPATTNKVRPHLAVAIELTVAIGCNGTRNGPSLVHPLLYGSATSSFLVSVSAALTHGSVGAIVPAIVSLVAMLVRGVLVSDPLATRATLGPLVSPEGCNEKVA